METPTGNWSSVNGTGVADGPQALALAPDVLAKILTVAPAVYGTITVVGLLGNLLVIYMLLCHSMTKDATHYYILNLALADALFMLGVPFTSASSAMGRWVFGRAACKIVLSLDALNMFSSVFNLAVLSVDRYLSIVCHASHPHLRQRKVVAAVCLGVWLAACLQTIPVMAVSDTVLMENGQYACVLNWPDGKAMIWHKAFTSYTFVIGFVVPVSVISVSYLLVVRHLRRNTSAHAAVARVSSRMRTKVVKTVTAMVLTFVVCWLPFHVCQLVGLAVDLRPTPAVLILFHITLAMAHVNSCVNPILYVFMSQKFRGSFRAALRLDPPHADGKRDSVARRRRLDTPVFFQEEKREEKDIRYPTGLVLWSFETAV
ncbi:Somatostatin receptor type 5 [Branchiostoma belcheri]|nr:Somatostatin receptor type 5 [Branchiostoma belcheri]